MKKPIVSLFISFIVLSLASIVFISFPGPALGWTESDVNTAFKLVQHTTKNDYPGGGSQNTTEGLGYRVENSSVESQAGFIRLTIMNRSDCPGQVATFRIAWSFDKDIGTLSGWTTNEKTWNVSLFNVTVQILEDGGGNTCIRANPEVRVEPTSAIVYVKPTGPTYYNPQNHPDHIPAQRNVHLYQPYNKDGGFRINIAGFPGLSYSAYYSYQGFKEDRAAVCSQYARRGVEQNQENLTRKCGYSGSAWHSDYNSHYNWCMTAERSAIDGGTRFRDDELKKCGTAGDSRARCDQYARRGAEQNQENLNRKCGYSGQAWHSDYNSHFNWCMTVDKSASDGGTRFRDDELKKCGTAGDNRARCDQYARRGVEQNQENLRRGCHYSGQAWHSDYNSHYNWCMTVDKSASDGGTRFRDDELKKCGTRNTKEFRNPSARGYRIDRCLYWGRDCDKPAADRFCRDNGYVEADSWQLAQARPTLILGDGKICNANYCGGFAWIKCVQGVR